MLVTFFVKSDGRIEVVNFDSTDEQKNYTPPVGSVKRIDVAGSYEVTDIQQTRQSTLPVGYTVIDKTDTTIKVGIDLENTPRPYEFIEFEGELYKWDYTTTMIPDEHAGRFCCVREYNLEPLPSC